MENGKPWSTAAAQNKPCDLEEYQNLMLRAQAVQSQLAEYCAAIEDFGLNEANAKMRPQPIRCSMGLLTPEQILRRADEQAQQLEQLLAQAGAARGRVLVAILRESRDAAQYRELCRRYTAETPAQKVPFVPGSALLFPRVGDRDF